MAFHLIEGPLHWLGWLIDHPWWLAAVVAVGCLLIGFGALWPLILFV